MDACPREALKATLSLFNSALGLQKLCIAILQVLLMSKKVFIELSHILQQQD